MTLPEDRGSGALELVVVVPAIVICVLFVVWCGRLGASKNSVELAASTGARAASLVSRERMRAIGELAARGSIEQNGATCSALRIAVEPLEHHVRVAVTCTTNEQGVVVFGSRAVSATAIAPIDRYRAGEE